MNPRPAPHAAIEPQPDAVLRSARAVIATEAAAIAELGPRVDAAFVEACRLILACQGRVVVTGMGKSGHVARKIAATLASTGTPAFFVHPGEASHGDLGMIQPDDVVLALSYSGETDELLFILPMIKRQGIPLIALTGKPGSSLASQADVHIDGSISSEACPLGLAPTTSTTAQLVMGDALAVSLLRLKGFTDRDFAKFHPGGALGKRLYLKVSDLSSRNAKPVVPATASLREIIIVISGNFLGATAVQENDQLIGIITDGDLRRMLEKNEQPAQLQARDICSMHPKTIEETELAIQALEMMRTHDITQLIVTDQGRYAGMVHLHDLIREGLI